jgi:ABC-2 type transport system ATP-binding protein
MILVREIHKSFSKVRAVRGVSFGVGRGEIVGLLGPNGAGKSTTMRIVTGYLRPDRGAVEIDGLDTLADSLQARRRIGYLPESAPLYPEMSVRGYLDFRARLFGLDRPARRRALALAMERCQLTGVAGRRVGQLSKGFRQRVGLASAILHDPPVLILDEPSNGLDPSQIRQTRSLVRELAEDRTMIVSSHILPEVERLVTRLVVIAGGRVRADGPLDAIVRARGGMLVEVDVTEPAAKPGALESLLGEIRGIAGVGAVERDGAGSGRARLRFRIEESAKDPRPEIAHRIVQSGHALREMREVRPTLERAFMDLIEEGEASPCEPR